jgi:hypothetical protein
MRDETKLFWVSQGGNFLFLLISIIALSFTTDKNINITIFVVLIACIVINFFCYLDYLEF